MMAVTNLERFPKGGNEMVDALRLERVCGLAYYALDRRAVVFACGLRVRLYPEDWWMATSDAHTGIALRSLHLGHMEHHFLEHDVTDRESWGLAAEILPLLVGGTRAGEVMIGARCAHD